MSNPITSQSIRVSFPEEGPNRSEVMQSFADNAVSDIQRLTRQSNLHTGEITGVNNILAGEIAYLRTGLRTVQGAMESQQANAETVVVSLDFYNKKNFLYAPNTPEQNKLVMNQRYGQVYLPSVNSTPVFYNEDAKTGSIYPNSNLSIDVIPVSEPVSAGSLPQIDNGVPENAFNGHNTSMWVRTVRYPLESPITEVSVQIDVTLPSESTDVRFNVVQIHPFPVERCDIIGIWYKPNQNSTFILLESFPQSVKNGIAEPSPDPIETGDLTQFFSQIKTIVAMRIQLRQRNWQELGNQKVFTYGLQELNVKLEEFSTVNSQYSPDLSQTNHLIYRVDAPRNTKFKNVTGIYINPLLNLETTTKESNHVIVYLSKGPNIDNPQNIIWRSYNSQLPQNSTSAIDLSLPLDQTYYYVIVLMKYVFTLKSSNSPFFPGSTPVLENMRMSHSVESLDGSSTTPPDSTDWFGRNWALHSGFVSHMDVYRGAVDDGSNILVYGDDFWSDTAWRSALHTTPLDGLAISDKLMSLTTNSNASNSTGLITYNTIPATLWGSAWEARRFRIQNVANIPVGGASVVFYFDYVTDQGPQTRIQINAADQAVWQNLPTGVGVLLSFTLSIRMTNSSTGGLQPVLGQFILLLKD